MKLLLIITTYLLGGLLVAQAQNNSKRSYTDYKPVYNKWQDSYILDKIEYHPDATIFHFRFICDNLNSGGAIFHPPSGKYAWYLKGRNIKRNFPLIAVKNIRRDGILIKKEVKNEIFESPPANITGYTIFSCEVHFGPLDNEVKTADLIEGLGQEYNKLHFNCFKIKLKTWDDETLGSEEDSKKNIAKFEEQAGKSTQNIPTKEASPVAVIEQKPPATATQQKEYEVGKKHLKGANDLNCNEVLILSGIHFQDNSTDYKGIIQARKTIEVLATALKKNPAYKLTLYGHTDVFGNKERNMELSRARVIKIQRWLSMYGIHPRRIDCKWYGSEKPIKPKGDPSNRRVEARLECNN